jgi:PAS domain S-box-containing protein
MTLFAAGRRIFSARNVKPFLPLLVFAAISLLAGATFYFSFLKIETLIQEEKLRDLGAIADMKASQIAAWRDTQIRLAESITRDSILAAEFGQWLEEGALPGWRRQRLRQMMVELQYVNRYKSVLLLDRQGTVRMSLREGYVLEADESRLAAQAMGKREEVFSDFHRNDYEDIGISIDLFAPLTVSGGKSGGVVGAAVLQIDPYTYLYPLINSWPVQSASAETLLVRRDGDDVLFLNDVRHMEGTALRLRMPLDSPGLPAAMAVRSMLRATDGVDYRGIPVVSEMRSVRGMPWFVVSKVDREELFAPINRLKHWSTGLWFTLVGSGGLLVFAWLQGYRERYRHLQDQHAAAVEREMLVKHFEYLTKYANDIIMVTDDTGKIVDANERAQEAYGYTRDEMLQMRIPDFRDPAEGQALFQRQLEQLRQRGELRYETVNLRKDRTRFPVEVSARLIDVRGVKYIQGIIRDISERRRAEDALRRSEALLRESQQIAHIGSWELDLRDNTLYWSDETYRIFEIPRSQFGASYEAFLNAVHPDDREIVNQAYTDSVKNRVPYTIVHRLLFPDQRIKYIQEWCETYYDDEGRPIRSIGTSQDITVRELAQNALRKSAQEIEDLYNHAPCGYHSLNKDGRIVQINNTELNWLGYSREEVAGKMFFVDLIAPGSRQMFRDTFPVFKVRGFVQDLEYELIRKDGTGFPVLLSATAVYDSGGQFVMSRSTLFDISARKLAEKRLGESEERFRTMADNAPIMIWMADAQDQQAYQGCNFFNKRWHDFTGLPFDQVHVSNWLHIVHEDDRQRCLDAYTMAFQNAQPFKLEYRMRRHDGVFRWMLDSGVPRVTRDGRFLGFIGTCLDITDQKLYEEIRAEVEHVGRINIAGEMASGLAHELSQPLTAANNYLDACLRRMAERDWDRENLQKAIRLAHAQTARAGQIINHLKSLVRKQKQERTVQDVNSLVRDTVTLLEHEFHRHFVTVEVDLSPLPPTLVNRIEVEQVLINLVKNAVDSMTSSPRRELRITTRTVESGAILVTVSDTGKGIAVEDLDKIFNPFQTSKKNGLGLGLAICRSLVESYGGQIWAENGEVGAEFNFTLPVGVAYA